MPAREPETRGQGEPAVPYLNEGEYPEQLRSTLEAYTRRMGFLPHALRVHMHRPEIAQLLWSLNNAIMRDPSSTLDRLLKRRVATVVSSVQRCAYCTAHHCSMLEGEVASESEGWGLTGDEVQGLLEGSLEPKDEVERVCFDYARAAARDATQIPLDVYDRLRKHLSPPQVVELACVVGLWSFYDSLHTGLKVPIEPHLVPGCASPAPPVEGADGAPR